MADCNTPAQPPCAPGPFDSPVCYTVPPSGVVFDGVLRVTINPDCSVATQQILDLALAPVPGAVQAVCDPFAQPTCCDPLSICAIVQTLPLQVPGVGDTALFVTPGGCFLGVPGGGGGGFPGYGIPVTTACANAAGVSLLVARADHVHRSALPVDDEGVLVGTRCSLNFIGDGVTAVDNPGLDRVDVTIPGFTGGTITSPILGANGSCAAPTYSFTASPDSGMFYTGTAVRISDDNCDDFIEIGASINITSTSGNVTTTAGGNIVNTATGAVTLTAGTTLLATATGTATLSSTGGAVAIAATTSIGFTTAATLRFTIQVSGAWNIGGSVGTTGQAILSNGVGIAPTWQTITPSGIGANQTIAVQDAGATEVTDPSTLNFNDGFVVTPAGAVATIDLDYGTPVATAQANAAGAATTVARSDHVHRTIVQVQDTGALISSRPTINFIDGAGITVTVVDNGGSDRADITIASTSGVTGFATPTVAADAAAATGGAATTAIRSDAKLQVATAVPPANTVDAGAPSVGVATTLLRSDAKLQALTAIVVTIGLVNAIGVAASLARSDHVHRGAVPQFANSVAVATEPGINLIAGTGITVAGVDAPGSDRVNFTISNSTGVTGFATPTVAADAAAATAGVATTAIRSDAKLSIATAAPVTVSGTVNSIGVATTIARSDHIHRLGVEVQEEGVLTATRPRLNFIGAAVTVTDDAGGDRANITITAAAAAFIQRFTFQADQFDSPVNANWAVNSLAPAAADSVNAAITVRRFDDTTEEGVGGLVTVPPGAVNVNFIFKWRAQTAPGAAAGVQPTYYTRSIPDNAAVGAWSAAVNFTALAVPTNANFQYDNQVISLATLGWTVNTLRQFEITRRGTQAGDTLAGDWVLAELILEFTT